MSTSKTRNSTFSTGVAYESIVSASLAFCLAGPISTPAAYAQAAATTTATNDHAVGSRIEKKIHQDATLKKYDIHVSVENGVATLSGTVPTEADRAKATQLATMSGIARVDNQILVDLNAGTKGVKGTTGSIEQKSKEGAEKTKDAAGKAADKTKDAAGKVTEKTKEGVSKTGEVITDSWITTRVKSKFLDESVLKGSDIHVETNDHVVTLTGTVPTQAGRARAVEQTKEVEGVHKVVDKLTVGRKK